MSTLTQLRSIEEFKIGTHYLIDIADYVEEESANCKVKVKLIELRKNENISGMNFNVCVFELEDKSPSCLRNELGLMFIGGKNIGDVVTLYDRVDDELFTDRIKVYKSPLSTIMIPKMTSMSLPRRANDELTKYTMEIIEEKRGGGRSGKYKKKKQRHTYNRRRNKTKRGGYKRKMHKKYTQRRHK